MGWNIGSTSQEGYFAGLGTPIQTNLILSVDPGNVDSYNPGSSTTAVTDMTSNTAMTLNGASWDYYDDGIGWSFDGSNDNIVSDSNIDVSDFYTGNSSTGGTATVYLWFRTGTNYVGSGGGNGPLISFAGYDLNVFFQSGNLTLFAADDDGGDSVYCPAASSTGDQYAYTALEGDNWYFFVGSINNTGSTVGDIPANTARTFVAKGDGTGTAELLNTFASVSTPASFEFQNTDGDLQIGSLTGNGWYFNGEIGPILYYNDCHTEQERVHTYQIYRHRYQPT
jgi:hypothetical protein